MSPIVSARGAVNTRSFGFTSGGPMKPPTIEYVVVAGGGGGGPAEGGYPSVSSGAGGSGIVSIRYLDSFLPAASTTGSPTITVSGGYRIYTWNGSGSITI